MKVFNPVGANMGTVVPKVCYKIVIQNEEGVPVGAEWVNEPNLTIAERAQKVIPHTNMEGRAADVKNYEVASATSCVAMVRLKKEPTVSASSV